VVNESTAVTSGTAGRRLGAEARRSQLVAAGIHLMRSVPLDQLTADHLAHAVGVSKGLVFHYFPSTRELHAAVLEAATAELVAGLDVDPSASPSERLRLGIDAFIAYIEQAPASYVAMARGSGSDPLLGAVFDRTRDEVVALVQGVLGAEELPAGLAIGLRGWIAFVEEAVLHWLAHDRPVPRDALVAFLQQTAVRMLPEALAMEAPQ
jgi:AcrR family transcriptional regulator